LLISGSWVEAGEVRGNVRELMVIFAPKCGFVFNQVHNIMGDIPPKNIVAMLDMAYEEGFKYGDEPA
jgi:hypothetical protein